MAYHRSLDLIAAFLLAVTVIALTFVGLGNTPLLAVLALPFVLVLPGYTLTCALLPERSLDVAERLLFSLGLSLVIAILGGLVLNLTPYGLEARSWSILLGDVTASASAVALLRRGETAQSIVRWTGTALAPRSWILFGLAAAVAAGSIAISVISATRQEQSQGFAELWILPGNTAGQQSVRLGVNNMQPTEVTYSLDVTVSGKPVHGWQSIVLKPHQSWEVTVPVPPGVRNSKERVDATLYRSSSRSTVYRHVNLWLGP